MRAQPVVVQNRKPGWWVSPSPTCVFPALNSRGKKDFGKPDRIVTALDIMTEGPAGRRGV